MVESGLPSLEGGDATLCRLAPKHLVHISSSSFRDDRATPHSCGGAIMTSQAWLELHNSVITGPGVTNAGAGSAIASASSAIILQDSRISNHRALANGGAFFQLRGRLWVTNCSLTDSHVTSNDGGGCMYVRDSLGVKLSGCLFDRCTSPAGGGALNIQTLLEDVPTPVLTIQDTTISRARSMRDGAALTSLKLDLVVKDTVFEHNQVCVLWFRVFQGSCLVPASRRTTQGLRLRRCVFRYRLSPHISVTSMHVVSRRQCDRVLRPDPCRCLLVTSLRQGYYGGVINLSQGTMTMTRTHFVNNTAMVGGQGGTIYALDASDANFTDCSWVNNSAYEGAGVYASRYGDAALWAFTRCKFSGNVADEKGAAVYTSGMNFTFTDTSFTGNKALLGAGIYATNIGSDRPLYMDFDNCTATGNRAEQSAGMAWLLGYKRVTLSKSSILGNRAGQSAGGLYLQNTPARLTGCVLQGNSARMGAAVMLQGEQSVLQAIDSRFAGNKVC